MTLSARASVSITITLNALPTSSGLTSGQCSTAYDNSTNLDELLASSGSIEVATSGTLTAGVIEVWVFSEQGDNTWPGLFTVAYAGSDASKTIVSRDNLFAGAALVASMPTSATNSVVYTFKQTDLVQLLGGALRKFAFFVTHNTGQNLASANNAIIVKPNYWA